MPQDRANVPAPDRNLALELVRVTEAAALAGAPWMGRGDKEAADQAAVDAMRFMMDTVTMDGVVVIGEGEKDEAPMLYRGERLGSGEPPVVDIAVDPIDGTTLTAKGMNGALAVVAVAERSTMFDPGPCVYMAKLARASSSSWTAMSPERSRRRARAAGSTSSSASEALPRASSRRVPSSAW